MLPTGSKETLAFWLRPDNGLGTLYAEVFWEPPECQHWCEDEVEALFSGYLRDSVIIVAHVDNVNTMLEAPRRRCLGFAAAVPLTTSRPFGTTAQSTNAGTDPASAELVLDASFFATYGIDASRAWYVADLGVCHSARRRGIASALLALACNAAPLDALYSVLRVSSSKDYAIELYRRAGFTLLQGFVQHAFFHVQGADTPVPIQKHMMAKPLSGLSPVINVA